MVIRGTAEMTDDGQGDRYRKQESGGLNDSFDMTGGIGLVCPFSPTGVGMCPVGLTYIQNTHLNWQPLEHK